MTDDLKQGDRVTVSDGEHGTVLDIDGAHVYMQLDNTRHMSALIGSLKKLDVEDDSKPHQDTSSSSV